MAELSSINFKKSNAINTEHNDRNLAPKYLLVDGGLGVECNRKHDEARRLKNQIISSAIQKYTERTGQKFQAKSYEWSAVVNLKPNSTMQDLEKLAAHLQEKYGFQCYQIAIHRDEGHINERGENVINHHAHLEFITLDKETGKNNFRREIIKHQTLRNMQNEVAEILQMQRGVDKRLSGAKRVEPRAYAKMKENEKGERAKEREKSKELQSENFALKVANDMLKNQVSNEKSKEKFTKKQAYDYLKEHKFPYYNAKFDKLGWEKDHIIRKNFFENVAEYAKKLNTKEVSFDEYLKQLDFFEKKLDESLFTELNSSKQLNNTYLKRLNDKSNEISALKQENSYLNSEILNQGKKEFENILQSNKNGSKIDFNQKNDENLYSIQEVKEIIAYKDELDKMQRNLNDDIELHRYENSIDKQKKGNEMAQTATKIKQMLETNPQLESLFSFEKYKKVYEKFTKWLKDKGFTLKRTNERSIER
jgi:hypothetical protein